MTTSNTFLLGGDLPVNRVGFGAMRLSATGFTGPARDPEAGKAVLRRAMELGINHIDTATIYRSHDGTVTANGLLRDALAPYPADLVIATKVGPWEHADGRIEQTDDPAALRPAIEANLAGLGVDRLDLVYLRVGQMEPPHGQSIAAQFEVLAQLREEGLIRHLGLSNVDTTHLAEARAIAPVAAVQNHFHAAKRDDTDLLAACEDAHIAFVPFFPLGGGMTDISTEALQHVADRHGATVHRIALAWLLAISRNTLVIPGTGNLDHLAENAASGQIVLTDDDLAELN
jgi:aryl-alcohol dehydrogenase-like predicted oxidoreductase